VANAGHGSAPDIAGRNIANPAGLMLSCAMLLEWLAERKQSQPCRQASRALAAAIDEVLQHEKTRTGDLGGRGTTSGFGEAVAHAFGRNE
jgi:isocitrate/isopropylmalate dehydrogenase